MMRMRSWKRHGKRARSLGLQMLPAALDEVLQAVKEIGFDETFLHSS